MRVLSLTSVIVGGLMLFALAVQGIAALDGRLDAGTPRPGGTLDVSYPDKPRTGCRHHRHRDAVERIEDWRAS